jgi:hypothetical protein
MYIAHASYDEQRQRNDRCFSIGVARGYVAGGYTIGFLIYRGIPEERPNAICRTSLEVKYTCNILGSGQQK